VIEANARYQVAVKFKTEAARRMLRATQGHVGRPVAILLDGQVVAAPTVRDPISESAILDGHYTSAEAERIAAGIRER
jgi:preprotein translocase subunit SecD